MFTTLVTNEMTACNEINECNGTLNTLVQTGMGVGNLLRFAIAFTQPKRSRRAD